MTNSINFKINNKLEVVSENEVFNCNIQDIEHDYLAISIPIKDFQYLPLKIGQKLEVLYYEDNCIYKFKSFVVKRSKSNSIPLIWMKYPQTFMKIQRRKFVRVPLLQDIKYSLINREMDLNKVGILNLKFFTGTMLDLSGSGAKLKINEDINKNHILLIQLQINNDIVFVKGEIKRIALNDLEQKICGIRFIELGDRDREKIVKYIFKVMRQQMKKGLKEE